MVQMPVEETTLKSRAPNFPELEDDPA